MDYQLQLGPPESEGRETARGGCRHVISLLVVGRPTRQLTRCLLALALLVGTSHGQAPPSPAPADAFQQRCQTAAVGAATFDDAGLIEYAAGDGRLILAAPHGGRQRPPNFPARTGVADVTATDVNTDRLARAIVNELAQADQRPHLIICHAQRRYIDANRPLDAACAPDSPAVHTWTHYQQAIQQAKATVTQQHGRGLFVELHGHGHPQPRLELGYLLRARDYELKTSDLEQLKDRCSLREIAEHEQHPFEQLLRGPASLGACLARQGVPSTPSPQLPKPGSAPYFNGGWNTLQHGSRYGGTISSLQIECHRPGIRDSQESIAVASQQIAAALLEFLNTHYPADFTALETPEGSVKP